LPTGRTLRVSDALSFQDLTSKTITIDGSQLLSSNRGEPNEAGNVAVDIARGLSGETPATIGKAFGMSNYSSVGNVVSRMKNEIREDGACEGV
jgi:hypothetical protein